MKKNVTVSQLFVYDQQIQAMGGTIQGEFFAAKSKAFYNDNGIKLNACYDRRDKFLKEWCVLDDMGKAKFTTPDSDIPELLEGKDPVEYKKAADELMGSPVAIEI